MSAEVSAVLALALGRSVDGRPFSWPAAFEVARQERCASLAWIRSGEAIRRLGPTTVVAAWRAEALAAVSLARFWNALTQRALGALNAAGVSPVVLKGLPLAQRLYAQISARPCADLDLYVAERERGAAHRALVGAGWRWRAGDPPREAGYVIDRDGRSAVLEIHSTLLDDGLVSHLPFAAPRATAIHVGEHIVPAHDDDQLPAYLATHLAKHSMPPLLWFVDFEELWASLDDTARDRAWAAARLARAHRYLGWAIRRAGAVRAAAFGDLGALRTLGFGRGARVDVHNALRVATLAATPLDAFRTTGAWIVPVELRGSWHELRKLLVRRFLKMARSAVRTRRTSVPPLPSDAGERAGRSVVVGIEDFDSLIKELAERDACFWIRAAGSSMQPSIPPGTEVRLNPARHRSIRVSDVVLAQAPTGFHILHRVRRVSNSWIQLQGDANVTADPLMTHDTVLAVADAVMIDGEPTKIPPARIARLERWVRAAFAQIRVRRTGLKKGRKSRRVSEADVS